MITTSAGRFRNRISQLSKKWSTWRSRPRARPMAVPITTARTKLAATRASVAPRCQASAPALSSLMKVDVTSIGPGSSRLCSTVAARCQIAASAAIEARVHPSRTRGPASLSKIVSPCGMEQLGIKARARTDQFFVAQCGQHVEHSLGRPGFSFAPRCRNTGAIERSDRGKLGVIGRLHKGAQPFPGCVRAREHRITLCDCGEKAFMQRSLGHQRPFPEDEANERGWRLDAERLHDLCHIEQRYKAAALQPRRKRPKVEHRIDPAIPDPLGQWRRGGKHRTSNVGDVPAYGSSGIGPKQEPALVDWTAGNPEAFSC